MDKKKFLEKSHRDDFDMEVIEEMEKKVKEVHPDAKIMFAGDCPEDQLPPQIVEAMEQLEKKTFHSMSEGRCMDCDKQMDVPPPWDDDEALEGWQHQEGWSVFHNNDMPAFFVCPDCDNGDTQREAGLFI